MTFFDFKDIPKGNHGVNNIERASFRVPTDASLDIGPVVLTMPMLNMAKFLVNLVKKP